MYVLNTSLHSSIQDIPTFLNFITKLFALNHLLNMSVTQQSRTMEIKLEAPALGDPSTLKTFDERVSWARTVRDSSIASVEPKLQSIPEVLPLSSQNLPAEVLTRREREITEGYTAIELLAVLRDRKVSVEEVTRAFLRRAALAHAAVGHHLPEPALCWPLTCSRPTV